MKSDRNIRRIISFCLGPIIMFLTYIVFLNAMTYFLPIDAVTAAVTGDLICLGFFGWMYLYLIHPQSERADYFSGSKWTSGGICVLVLFACILWYGGQYCGAVVSSLTSDALFAQYEMQVTQNNIWLTLFLTACIAPVVEELLYRGIIYRCYRKVLPGFAAAILSSIIFAVSHGTLTHLAPSFLFGLFAAFLYELTDNLLYSILFHLMWNLGTISAISHVPSVYIKWSIFILVFCALFVSLVLLWKYIRKLREVFYHPAADMNADSLGKDDEAERREE